MAQSKRIAELQDDIRDRDRRISDLKTELEEERDLTHRNRNEELEKENASLREQLRSAHGRIRELESGPRKTKAASLKVDKAPKAPLKWKTEMEAGMDGKDRERCEARMGKECYTITPAYNLPGMDFGGYHIDHYPLANFDPHAHPRMTTTLKQGVKTIDQAKAIAQADWKSR